MEKNIALLVDFESLARGVRHRRYEERVDLKLILAELERRGRVVMKRAYADWGYYKDYRNDLLQHGIEGIHLFAVNRDQPVWKNGAEVKIAVDAIDALHRQPLITDFVIVSGEADLLSLVTRLRESGKNVIGIGLRTSASQFLVKNCDEYFYYDDMANWPETEAGATTGAQTFRDSKSLLMATMRRMSERQGLPGMPPPGTPLKVGAVRAAMRRQDPSWEESVDGYSSFLELLQANKDTLVFGRPVDAVELYVAERGTLSEVNLHRMLESAPPTPGEEPCTREEMTETVRRCLRSIGSPDGDDTQPQRLAVRASLLRQRLTQEVPEFDEGTYGCASFLDFLLLFRDHFRAARAEGRADILVAERDSPADHGMLNQPEASGGAAAAANPVQRYMSVLRGRRIRHVPAAERYTVIRELCRLFDDAFDADKDISLKEAKDQLHAWFEANRPEINWDSINNVVYHLFWTYCFEFDDASEDVPLWDRPTHWFGDLETDEEIIRRCDLGLVRMLSEQLGALDPQVVLEVLGDGDETRLSYFEELVETAMSQRAPSPVPTIAGARPFSNAPRDWSALASP